MGVAANTASPGGWATFFSGRSSVSNASRLAQKGWDELITL